MTLLCSALPPPMPTTSLVPTAADARPPPPPPRGDNDATHSTAPHCSVDYDGDGDDDYKEVEFGPLLGFDEVLRLATASGVMLPADMMELAKDAGIRKDCIASCPS